MTCCTTCMRPADQERRGPSTLADRAAHLIRRSWNAYWERRARRATVLLLRSLGPRTLADIGIKPGEIESVVYGSSEDRRRPYDAAWRRRTYC